jgi:hypothetical protein
MRSAATWLISLILILSPGLMFMQRAANTAWAERLALPQLVAGPHRHTPRYFSGTFLPPVITKDTTLTAAHNPVILPHTTHVASGATLILEPGVEIWAHEFAALTIEGVLISRGTNEQPVRFESNELHPDNQFWGGLIFEPGSVGTVTYTRLTNASPGVSCLADSRVAITDTTILNSSVGVYTASPTCTLTRGNLRGVRVGVAAQGVEPAITDTVISARTEAIHKALGR